MEVYKATDIGLYRSNNQDYVYATADKIGNLDNLLIVADGMGGHSGGDYASKYTVESVVKCIESGKYESPVENLRYAVENANSELKKEASLIEEYSEMATTLVVATIRDGVLFVANIGDSRLYLIDNDIIQITKDHSLVEEMVDNGEITKSEARIHPRKNVITRAVGTYDWAVPDIFEVELTRDSKVLLCTDGLTNMLEDREIFDIVKKNSDIKSATRELISRANLSGGSDNISVVLADKCTL